MEVIKDEVFYVIRSDPTKGEPPLYWADDSVWVDRVGLAKHFATLGAAATVRDSLPIVKPATYSVVSFNPKKLLSKVLRDILKAHNSIPRGLYPSFEVIAGALKGIYDGFSEQENEDG